MPIMQRHAMRRSAGCCFIHSASCGAPTKQDCIEMSAKLEVVTVCSWQFAGEDKLQSTAMIAIMIGPPRRDGRLRRCAYCLRMPCRASRGRDQTAERGCRIPLELLEKGELAPARILRQIG